MTDITGELKSWNRCAMGNRIYYTGFLFGDTKKRWREGAYIRTSYVKEELDLGDHWIVNTRNSVYKCMKSTEGLKIVPEE